MIVPAITRRTPKPPKWVPKRLGRLTVDQYEAMVNSDVFTKHDNLVLINGYLVTKVTKKPPHVIAGELLRDELIGIVPRARWRVMVEAPVRIPDYNEPEPDISLARGTANDYADRHPGPADLGLVVEVAKSSLAEDRRMAGIYGPAGIPVYWIVNFKDRQVEVYTLSKRRGAPGYGKPRIYKAGQSVPVIVEGQEIGRIAVVAILRS
jgi:Uma2 family endonuclease